MIKILWLRIFNFPVYQSHCRQKLAESMQAHNSYVAEYSICTDAKRRAEIEAIWKRLEAERHTIRKKAKFI